MNIIVSEILVNNEIWVLSVLGDIVNIDATSHFNDQIQSLVKSIVKISPIFTSLLESTVKDNLFDGWSLLIIQKSEVVSVLTNLGQDVTWMSETVTDSNTLQASDSAVVILSFSEDFLSDGWGIFTSVTFTKYVERMARFKFK